MTKAADLDAVKAALAERGADLAVELFGAPTKRTAREWRWGRKGSVVVRWRGRDGPTFYSFEAMEGGSLLDAIMFAHGGGFTQALRWARDWLGGAVETPTPRPRARARAAYDADADEARRVEAARDLWRAGRPARAPDAAGRYLVGRAIEDWPLDTVRFLPAGAAARDPALKGWRWCAAMIAATDDAGNVRAVQLVALRDDGRPVLDDGGRKMKRTRGALAGCAARFPARTDAMADALLICEGPETALSVWLATGCETWSAFGGVGNASLRGVPVSRDVVICRDDDPRKVKRKDGTDAPNPAVVAVRKAVAALRAEGRPAVEALPWRISRGDKSDFNDVLKAEGVEAVRARIAAALAPRDPGPDRGVVQARVALAREVDAAVSDLTAWRPTTEGEAAPFDVIRAALGVGKSRQALRAAVQAIGQGHRALYLAPTHKLAGELAARAVETAADMGVTATVRVWRGREQLDDDGAPMCLDTEAAETAADAGLNVLEAICKVCQHRETCAYMRQRAASADLWLAPTALLWADRPAAMKSATLAVIDEAFALDGMTGTQGRPPLVSVADLDAMPAHGRKGDAATADLLADIMPTRRRLAAALADHPTGPVEADRIAAAGLTADDCDRARRMEGQRVQGAAVASDATRAARLAAIRAAGRVNKGALRMAALWGALAELLRLGPGARAGRLDVRLETDDESGATFKAVALYGVRRRGKGWTELPTLHLDATASMPLIRQRVPHARLRADLDAAAPAMRVRLHVGRAFGKRGIDKPGSTLRDVWRRCVVEATAHGGRWLVISNKDAVEAIRGAYTVPDFMALAHFNAVAGRDEWEFPDGETVKGGDVRGVIVLGRPMPPPAAVERIAGVLTGRAVETPLSGWYPVEAVTLRGRDGSARTVEADRHPDPLVDAVRGAICDGELLQAIGRGRGVGRSVASPLDVLIFGNVPLPLPAETVGDWREPTLDEALLADHGAVPSSQGDAAKLADMTPDAARVARQRDRAAAGKIGTDTSNKLLLASVPNLAVVVYQTAGRGRTRATLAFDPRRIPDPGAWLTAKLGPLAYLGAVEADADLTKPDIAAAPADLDAGPSKSKVDGNRPPPVMRDALADLAATLGDWRGGKLPATALPALRDAVRASGERPADLAARAGVSRPHFVNAMRGRNGLSPDAADTFRALAVSLLTRRPAQTELL